MANMRAARLCSSFRQARGAFCPLRRIARLLLLPCDVGVCQVAGSRNLDVGALYWSPCYRRNRNYAVGVDIEGNLNLRHAAGAGGMPVSPKRPSVLLSAAIAALALQDMDINRGLVVGSRGEYLRLLGGMVVLRSMSFVNTPPIVSMPSESGGLHREGVHP